MTLEVVSTVWAWWRANNLLLWGLGPFLCFLIGFLPTALFFEWIITQPFAKSWLINQEKTRSRTASLEETRKKIPFIQQVKTCCWILFGPTSIIILALTLIVNIAITALIFPIFLPTVPADLPTLYQFVVDLILLELLGDFLLYVGHRVQHEIPFFWKNFHSYHHQIDTPSPVSTLFIDTTDATLQGGLPLSLSLIILKPHPITFYVYFILRIAENVFNHSGRANVRHHDGHHKYSNYEKHAKNFGENFWIWDWMFGTLSNRLS